MSISTAMFSAITGLNAMGNAMSVIGNNIANVNTVGFKSSRSNFMDLLSQSSGTGAGQDQIGRGVQIGSVSQIFSQGAFQNSSQATDIAISGDGFFVVRDPLTEQTFYTRAGNFSFDTSGRLVNPAGYILQGWELDSEGNRIGTPVDVQMVNVNAPPAVTTQAHYVANLDATAESATDGVSLSAVWDGTDPIKPIAGDAYVYQSSLRIYDNLGSGHDLSIYFDPDDTTQNVWEYIICSDPSSDLRTDDGSAAGDPFADTAYAGLLMRGTITFDPASENDQAGGRIADITAEAISNISMSSIAAAVSGATWPAGVTLASSGTYTGGADKTFTFTVSDAGAGTIGGVPAPEVTWDDGVGNTGTLTLDSNGPHTVNEGLIVTFGGAAGPLAVGDDFTVDCTATSATWTAVTPNANGYHELTAAFLVDPNTGAPLNQAIELNLGAKNPYGASTWALDNLSTTQYASSSTTLFQTQDGFASGYLQSVAIDQDGIMTGTFSNGNNQQAFQLGLALFRNQWGLQKIGANLYAETRLSGQGTINPVGTGGNGQISPNSLEQSNVDLAEEFVDMIIQQRGFQANSKIITTTDAMLSELIQLKR